MLYDALRFGNLPCSDIHTAIYLHGIGAYDFTIKLERYELGKGAFP